MKRPILIATIGYIIGILVGLYFKFSVVLLYILIVAIVFISRFLKRTRISKQNNKFKLISFRRYFRYFKIFVNSKVILLIIFFSVISNTIVIYNNMQYDFIEENFSSKQKISIKGIIISSKKQGDYYDKYILETNYKGKKINLYISIKHDSNSTLKYGNSVEIIGEYIKPETQRNFMGFNYKEYLKQLDIYGTINCQKINILSNDKGNTFFRIADEISNNVKLKINEIMSKETASIIMGIILGDTTHIDDDIQNNFRNASMSHILAVSGMHVSYILLGINLVLKRFAGKRKTNIVSIIILIFYMFITNFSPSITRAGLMGIILLISKLIYRKNDVITSVSLSLLLILLNNPFSIQNVGLQLSYTGTIGIMIFQKPILQCIKNIKIKNIKLKYKIKPRFKKLLDNIKEIISISLSVQIAILPILLYNFNIFSSYFLISNLLLSIFIAPIIILGFIFIIIVLINSSIAKFISYFLNVGIQIIIYISQIGELPNSKIYIATPRIWHMILYYFIIIISKNLYTVFFSKNLNNTQIRVKNLIALIKYKYRNNKRFINKILICIALVTILINNIPKSLNIYFIDVMQGDSCFIVTPKNKTILIDGGGSKTSSHDVGKNTLLPYILDRGCTKIDVIIISHCDSDHIRTGY